MSKARTTVKYTIAGAATALYGTAIYTVSTKQEIKQASPKQVVVVSAAMIALTWIAALA